MEKLFILIFSLIGISQAFLFWGSSKRQEAVTEIDRLCTNKAEDGDCRFYTCFDLRHPCELHNWALSYGWRYCRRFNQEYERFTPEGQTWINNTRTCTMKKLLTFYHQDFIHCEHLEHEMKRVHAECEHENGVCDVDMLLDNNWVLMDVYKFSRRGMVRFLMFIHQCGGTELDEFVTWMSEKGSTHADAILDKLHDWLS